MKSLLEQFGLDDKKMPEHIAIIMDGNGRWAQKKLLSRIAGHKEGVKRVQEAIETCLKLNIPNLTLYAFSTENWTRPKKEVLALMSLLNSFLSSQEKLIIENDICLKAIGEISKLSSSIQTKIKKLTQKSKNNKKLNLTIALSYGSRAEMVCCVKKIAQSVKNQDLKIQDITEDTIKDNLYTKNLKDPDILIRTSGEERISNFFTLADCLYRTFFCQNSLA